MDQLSITFQHHQDLNDLIEVRWNINKTPAGLLWSSLLKKSMDNNCLFHPRFTGFLFGPKDMKYLSQLMNKCIETINSDSRYKIKEKADGTWSQDFSNIIHHHFELLCGTMENPTQYYRDSEMDVKYAVLGLNQISHDMEALFKARERVKKFPDTYFSAIIMQVFDGKRFAFPDFIHDQFSLSTEFGAIHLNYSQIGKTWWEVFLDEDEHIYPEAIVPHFALNGGFDIYFGEYSPSKDVLKKFHDFLKNNGQNPSDPKLCLGYCQVAKLENPKVRDRQSWRKLIGEHCEVKKISLLRSGILVSEKVLDEKNPHSYLYEV